MKRYDIEHYRGLIPAHHRLLERFPQVVTALVTPTWDSVEEFNRWLTLFEIETATGKQLDILGEWIGITRYLPVAITGVYFSFDDASEETWWGAGYWKGKYDAESGLSILGDADYRKLLMTMILVNHWDGSFQQLRIIWDHFLSTGEMTVFQWMDETEIGEDLYWDDDTIWDDAEGRRSVFTDNQDMTFSIGYIGDPLLNLALEYAKFGARVIKPMAVRLREFFAPPDDGILFAWDFETPELNGWGLGGWFVKIATTEGSLLSPPEEEPLPIP